MKKIDLHTHTTASDGVLSPEDVVARALDNEVDILAITDHDTVSGLESAHKFNENRLLLLNGIEISTNWNNNEIHIVGINIDKDNEFLLSFIEEQQEKRELRAIEIGRRLEKAGILNSYMGAKEISKNNNVISRNHFALWLIEQGIVRKKEDAFKKYLKKGKVGYAPNNWPEIEIAINIIHKANGVAILAHPTRYKLSKDKMENLISEFSILKGDGIEVSWSKQDPNTKKMILNLAIKYNLLHSVGSDFHMPVVWSDIGKNLISDGQFDWIYNLK